MAPVTRLGGGWPYYHCAMTKFLTLHSASSDITATGRGGTLQYGQPEVGIQAGADWWWWWDENPGFLGPLIPSQWECWGPLRSLQEVED